MAGIIMAAPNPITAHASATSRATLYVANSPTSRDDPGFGTDASCSHAYLTINYAVGQASPGDTVVVCPGIYAEQVLLDKRLVLRGISHPVIDPGITGIAVTVAADDVTVRGLTLQNSFAGIDVQGVHGALITGNAARTSLIGINIERSAYSRITNNKVDDNLCMGISLFALGPQSTDHISVTGNQVEGNVTARCLRPSPGLSVRLQGPAGGIILAAQAGGMTTGNLVSGNVVRDNGDSKALPGAGIMLEVPFGISFAGPGPVRQVAGHAGLAPRSGNGTPGASGSVSANTVAGNRVDGNGLPGVTVLNASPHGVAKLNGNDVAQNLIGCNNTEGMVIRLAAAGSVPRALGGRIGLPVVVRQTTGILAASESPLAVRIFSNAIAGDFIGIWLSRAVIAPTAPFNQFIGVTVPIVRFPPWRSPWPARGQARTARASHQNWCTGSLMRYVKRS